MVTRVSEQLNTQNNSASIRSMWGTIFYNAKVYDLVGDGTTNDYTKLYNLINTTINGAEATIIFPKGTYKISSNITIPSNISLYFVKGAMLSPDSGVTVTINGPVQADMWRIFTGSGTIAGSMKVDAVYPQWWGAKGDYDEATNTGTDDTVAIQTAINYASTLRGGTTQTTKIADLIFPSGVYKVSGNLTMSDNYKFCNLIGKGAATLYQTGTGVLLHIGNDLDNGIMPVRVKNLFFKRVDKLAGTVGLKVEQSSNGYFENLGSSGFETAFLSLGCINNLWDFKRNFVHGNKYGFVADISIVSGSTRFDSNLLHIQNAHFAGEYGITLQGTELAGGTGSGGLVKLSFCTFEGITNTSLRFTNAGEIKGLDTVEIDHCWFESYGPVLASITSSNVRFQNCFFVGASSKVVVLENDSSSVTFDETYGYFLDSAPTSGCLVEKGTGATNTALTKVYVQSGEFSGLTAFISTTIKELLTRRNIKEQSRTVKLGPDYPAGNTSAYNQNLQLNLYQLILDAFGAMGGKYVVDLEIMGSDGIGFGNTAYKIFVNNGNQYVVTILAWGLTLSGSSTAITLNFPTSASGDWYNSRCKLRLTIVD